MKHQHREKKFYKTRAASPNMLSELYAQVPWVLPAWASGDWEGLGEAGKFLEGSLGGRVSAAGFLLSFLLPRAAEAPVLCRFIFEPPEGRPIANTINIVHNPCLGLTQCKVHRVISSPTLPKWHETPTCSKKYLQDESPYPKCYDITLCPTPLGTSTTPLLP